MDIIKGNDIIKNNKELTNNLTEYLKKIVKDIHALFKKSFECDYYLLLMQYINESLLLYTIQKYSTI